jgi:acetylornithine deacetylase/succinyl-diaminopimelate desuccinylase-like protein
MLVQVKVNLRETVLFLSEGIGTRSYRDPESLGRSAGYIEGRFRSFGLAVERQPFTYEGRTFENVITEVRGTTDTDGIYVVGAHYDLPGPTTTQAGLPAFSSLPALPPRTPRR